MEEAQARAIVDHRVKYTQETIEKVLKLKVEGRTYSELSRHFQIPVTTLMAWRKREVFNGTELGKQLCSAPQSPPKESLKPELVRFPGGSVYTVGHNGKLVDETARHAEAPPQPVVKTQKEEVPDEALVDQILHELALKIGQQFVEITALKTKLKRC
jgi:hypothetical protein